MRGSYVVAAMLASACGSGSPRAVEITDTTTSGAGPVAAAANPLAVWPMDGPYPSLDALCAPQIEKAQEDFPDEEMTCRDDEPGPRTLEAPYRGARVVVVGTYEPTCHLVIEMADGSWHRQMLGICDASDTRSTEQITMIDLAASDLLPGGAPEVRLRYQQMEMYSNMDNDGLHSETRIELHVVCGVGASGRPACVEAFGVEESSFVEWLDNDRVDPELAADRPPPGRNAWKREVTYQADAIVLGGLGQSGNDAEARTGRHPVVFP